MEASLSDTARGGLLLTIFYAVKRASEAGLSRAEIEREVGDAIQEAKRP